MCAAWMPGAYATYVVTIIYNLKYNKYSRFKYLLYFNLGDYAIILYNDMSVKRYTTNYMQVCIDDTF